MRILNVTQSYAPFYEFGGPPVKVEALSTGLRARGHEVTVLTADWGLEERMAAESSTLRQSAFGWERRQAGALSVYLPSRLRYHATSWNPAVGRFCEARLKEFDVVHIFGLYDLLGPEVASACRRFGIPYVVEPIGMFVPIVRNILLKRLYHAVLGRKMLGGAAAIVATAEQEVEELVAGGIARDRIVLRRNGIAAPRDFLAAGQFRKKQGIPSEARLVLFLGRLSEKKSPELLLEAFAQMTSPIDGREVWLAFVGPDEDKMRKMLEARSKSRGVAGRTVFSGPVFGDDRWSAYRDADVFVLPSQNENFGNTALEAAACGTPVVVTEGCGVAPLLRDHAGIVVAHETAAVGQAVKRLLSEAQLHQRLSAGGKLVAGRLGWDEPVEEMERVYVKLAAHRAVVGQSASQA